MTEAPFALRGLGMEFGGVFACRGIDIDFAPGEVHAVVGENGDGKSTTMKCLAGLYLTSAIRIEVDNMFRVIRELKAQCIAVAYVPHRLDEVFAMADRITVLRDGRLVETAPTASFSRSRLVQLMVGRPLADLFARSFQPVGPPAL